MAAAGNLARGRSALGDDRFLIGMVVAALALIGAGLIAALAGVGRPSMQTLDPTSPAGTVERYATAVRGGDVDQAYGFLSEGAQASWSLDRYRESFPRYAQPTDVEQRVLIEPVAVDGDRAQVRVTINRFIPGNPFFASTSRQEVTVYLVRENSVWKVDRPLDTYPFVY
jgi:hypothetical protein